MLNEQELGKFLSAKRLWVWPDKDVSTDANAGTFENPLMSYEAALARAKEDTVIIVVPARKDLFK